MRPARPSYNTTTWKGAGTWEPFDGLKFRGNYQRAVRAPNIGELFAPPNTGLTTVATDPCRTTRHLCRAGHQREPSRGLPRAGRAAVAPSGASTTRRPAQANATTAGSLALRPEKANS